MFYNKQKYFTLTLMLGIVLLAQTVINKKVQKVPKSVIEYMATREVRYHHFLWHQIRNVWHLLDELTQQQIRDLGWEPPRPALRYGDYGEAIAEEYNDSGEDFFYMHCQMIAQVNKLIQKKCPRNEIQGFQTIPGPGEYPLDSYTLPGEENQDLNYVINYIKSDDFFWQQIKPSEDAFKDPEVLRTMSLGQLGSQIEFTIHNWLHLRFSQAIFDLRPTSGDVVEDVDHRWDDPKYNTLLDTYSSHVNQVFWLIHGWVDDRIKDWQKANGVETIEWKGTWIGGSMSSMSHIIDKDNDHSRMMMAMESEGQADTSSMVDEENDHIKTMEKLIKILLASGKCYQYHQKVQFLELL